MAALAVESDPKRDRLVIVASTLGTVFEWYDFFVYGTLASIVAGHFFPSDNPAVSFLIFLASFGVGFGMLYQGKIIWRGPRDRLYDSGNPYVDQFVQGRAEGPIR